MFLGTQFELTRISHPKIKQIEKEDGYREQVVVEHFLDGSLLEAEVKQRALWELFRTSCRISSMKATRRV
jgi:hypothetical protein